MAFTTELDLECVKMKEHVKCPGQGHLIQQLLPDENAADTQTHTHTHAHTTRLTALPRPLWQ